jgi:N-acetylmuramoyl-L-alanine amidase
MNTHSSASLSFITSYKSTLRWVVILCCLAGFFAGGIKPATATTAAEQKVFEKSIIDKQRQLNAKFVKRTRRITRYIIVHTSEGGLNSTLRTVLKGKKDRAGRKTRGGHANYVIARDGRTFRTLDKRYQAHHAGLSMWNGESNISRVSIGIELVGYHYSSITARQYRSLELLLDTLQRIYRMDDLAVLTHSQIAYGKPNRWNNRSHRGRKRCAKNFDRTQAGLRPTWSYDPDVKAGRLAADPELSEIYYARHREPVRKAELISTNIITRHNTAWNIAGEDYDSPSTLYQLPNGKTISGDQIENRIGWKRLPVNTVVMLNQHKTDRDSESQGPVKKISNGLTAWDIANLNYNKSSTFYIFPNGRVKNGHQISDWDGLPPNTRMIIGYQGPYRVTSGNPASKIAGWKYNHEDTLYYFPNKKIVSGKSIKDFKRLPEGVLIFIPAGG